MENFLKYCKLNFLPPKKSKTVSKNVYFIFSTKNKDRYCHIEMLKLDDPKNEFLYEIQDYHLAFDYTFYDTRYFQYIDDGNHELAYWASRLMGV